MRLPREILATIADNEPFQHALILYNEALLAFHALPFDVEPDLRESARSAFESAGNGLQAAIDLFTVDRICDLMRRMRQTGGQAR